MTDFVTIFCYATSATAATCAGAATYSLKEGCGCVFNKIILERSFVTVVMEVNNSVYVVYNNFIVCRNVLESDESFTASNEDSSLDMNIAEGDVSISYTIRNNKVAVDCNITKNHITASDYNGAFFNNACILAGLAYVHFEKVMEELGKFSSCYCTSRHKQTVAVSADILLCSHTGHAFFCPIINFVFISKHIKVAKVSF